MAFGLTDVLTLLGALGLFLYGMKLMSDALMELAGDRMRSILATATANRFLAVLTGFAITATLQSSSATTLMVVSFVNAGLLTLVESIGVIMGANIGTTVTAWLISILGFKVSMSAIALPLVGFGFLLTVLRDERHHQWGYFVIGFAVLFIGLQFLKESMPDIGGNADILQSLVDYTNMGMLSVLLFLMIGTLLTLVLQSSSATIAVTLVMTYEGWIPFDMAAAMVLGENIGTTITANLAALIANNQAKRAARAHLIFNLLGISWMLMLFYPFLGLIDSLVGNIEGVSPIAESSAVPVALSLFHTTFNLLNTALMLGLVPVIARIVTRLVPPDLEPELESARAVFLNKSSMEYPETAIKALFDESLHLLERAAYKAVAHGLSVHRRDLQSDKHLRELVASHEVVSIDIEKLFETRIKSIYSQILEYATHAQSEFSLDENQVETVRNILVADRMLVQTVKQMAPLHHSIVGCMAADNDAMLKEYNTMRRFILKVIRQIHRASKSEAPLRHIRKLEKQRAKASKLDVLLSGRITQLLNEQRISRDMAATLINDSERASRIMKNLIDVASLLYYPRDRMFNILETADEK